MDSGESGDDLDPASASGFGRLSRVGVDGGLTGALKIKWPTSGGCTASIMVGILE